MDRLSIVISMLTGAAITGVLTVIAFTMGYYNWYAIGGAAIIGFVLAWPTAYLVSRRIKENDPSWDADKVKDTGLAPKPSAPRTRPSSQDCDLVRTGANDRRFRTTLRLCLE